MAFYDAVINQSASFRNYQTEVRSRSTATSFANRDHHRQAVHHVRVHGSPGDLQLQPGHLRRTSRCTTRPSAIETSRCRSGCSTTCSAPPTTRSRGSGTTRSVMFSSVTNSQPGRQRAELKERIAIRRYENVAGAVQEVYGDDVIDRATGPDNPQQIFVPQSGEEFVYTHLEGSELAPRGQQVRVAR